MPVEILFLTKQFYVDYENCPEIEKKDTRPYTQVELEISNIKFAVPLRSGIKHPHVYWTNKKENCGLDFSKAVVVEKNEYIDQNRKPHIREDEFKVLKGKEYIISTKLISYIKKYKKAKTHLDIEHNKKLCMFSTLQYFEDAIENIE